MVWHMLDAGSIWLKEFASSLAELVHLRCWNPEIRNLGMLGGPEQVVHLDNPKLAYTSFPLQRGYSRWPLSYSSFLGKQICNRLLRETPRAPMPTLICTSPFYAFVAESWPGQVVYYLTDFTPGYHGMDPERIRKLDARVCRIAKLVCPNSRRCGDYLVVKAGCDPAKVLVIPNATRAQNVMERPLISASLLPECLRDLPRPIAGIIGNLAANMDWVLLRELIDRSPGFSWAFVGPLDMPVPEAAQAAARAELVSRGGRVRFTGAKPYGELWQYGRAFDVALMPYRRQEPTFSGSATRFYEHLAACRPILATRGVEELLHQEPLLQLIDTAQEGAEALSRLQAIGFRDGQEERRWKASLEGTWDVRAQTLVKALAGAPHVSSPKRAKLASV